MTTGAATAPPAANAAARRRAWGSALSVTLPPGLEAHEPPEARGLTRADVRLLVSRPGVPPRHARFVELPRLLAPGDLLVVNTSATLAAALDARLPDGSLLVLHVSTRLPAGLWLVELRRPDGRATVPWTGDATGLRVTLPADGGAEVLAPYPGSARLWVAALHLPAPLPDYLGAHGRPIRYGYVPHDWPLSAYQTVWATEPGSAEMPSAGRPFTADVVTALVARGIALSPVVLHAGVSSPEAHEPPFPEEFRVPPETALRVNATRAAGGRVVAVGTTVVRALETVADAGGTAHPGRGWTELVVSPDRGVRVVDALLTGWHVPEASHWLMLEALAGPELLEPAYRTAVEAGYRWHEFGDLHLIFGDGTGPRRGDGAGARRGDGG